MRVVGLQKIDGSWADAAAVIALSGVSDAVFAAVQAEAASAFPTALAVAVLRRRCAGRESAWRLVERKALAWLTGELGSGDAAEALIARLAALL
jgi:hypothetical protein